MPIEKRVLSLFSGCGGMDLGFEGGFRVHKTSINNDIQPTWLINQEDSTWVELPKTQFKTIFANDILTSAEGCWLSNFPSSKNVERRFHRVSIVDLVKQAWEGKFQFPDAEVVTGGFPCQDFSLAGNRKGFNSHKDHNGDSMKDINVPSIETRGMLYYWMRNVIELVLPTVFIAENVKGIVSLGDTKQIIEQDFRNVGPGYIVVDAMTLNAKDFGVPQNRERVIFIGLRSDKLTSEAKKIFSNSDIPDKFNLYPEITHGPTGNGKNGSKLLSYTTVRDYISDLEEPEISEEISHQTYSKAKFYGKHLQGNKEIDLDSVSPTIRSEHHGNIEFRRLSKENGGRYIEELKRGMVERRLSVRECARVQTFPDNFQFVIKGENSRIMRVNGSDAYKLIGNAVPPLLAYHIAQRLENLWPEIIVD